MATQRPCGNWESPITLELAAAGNRWISELFEHETRLHMVENRPDENGCATILSLGSDGTVTEILPPGFSVLSRVNEYGGRCCVSSGESICFSNATDQKIYSLVPGQDPRVLTQSNNRRYADMVYDRQRQQLICVCEDHTEANGITQYIVTIKLASGEEKRLEYSSDFVAYPRLSPDGNRLAWISWNLPFMPFQNARLCLAGFSPKGELIDATILTAEDKGAVNEPRWSPDGQLHFISDSNGWSNIYRWDNEQGVKNLTPSEREFGETLWGLGSATYGVLQNGRIVASCSQSGSHNDKNSSDSQLVQIEPDGTTGQSSLTNFSAAKSLLITGDDQVFFIACTTSQMPVVCQFDPKSGEYKQLYKPAVHGISLAYISKPEAICFPATNKTDCHAYFYPPMNTGFAVPSGEKPPLIVNVHGGPTSREHSGFGYVTQFWTSRGFAVVNVNYRGSTGYGRAYRDALQRNWGIVDVEDCIAAARYLVERGDVDAKRLVIRGPSAGGYTTLQALIEHSVFAAGVDLFGPADLESSILEGHRFESGYFEYLVGAYPQEKQRLLNRSPLYLADKIEQPLLVLQGGLDRVVPPQHSQQIVENLRQRNIFTKLVLFEDEAHGFRKSQNIRRSYAAELKFYRNIFELG